MALHVDVPLNTALADLDEALRALLRRELGRHGFENVDIAFDAPSKDWSGKLTNPTVNCFLYDLREATEQAAATSRDVRTANGEVIERPPALKLEATYSLTAWTKAVEDEHRLLSQVLAVLFSHRAFPADLFEAHLAGSVAGTGVQTAVGRPREDKSDFWSAVGGQYKASVDYVVRLDIESGAVFTRGPEVRVQTLRPRLTDAPRTVTELVRFGGTVRDAEGSPVPDAWVALPEAGMWTSTDRDGRFIFNRVRTGTQRVVARTVAGDEADVTADVPGTPLDLVVGAGPPRRRR